MNTAALKDLYDRKARALAKRPVFARGAGSARVRLAEGMACEVEHAQRTMRVDLPGEEGGMGTAPHPGELMRASIGACLIMGYRIWGARLDVPIDAVALEITCEFDARGQLGIAEVPVGWNRLCFQLTIASPAPAAAVRQVVDTGNRLSPMLANLSPAIVQVHRLTIVPR